MIAVLLLLVAVASVHGGIKDPNFADGRKVIVHLFEWKWTDIAAECERFLGPYGFAGVQVSPPSEHLYYTDKSPQYPWWQRYQPVSYKLNSRSGSRAEFADMVTRCNNQGVRIYVDAVINHMQAGGYSYPAVPYSQWDFNVPRGKCSTESGNIENYGDANQVRNCNLLGLNDLYFGGDNNRHSFNMVIGYLQDLISLGVAGFRVDAAKHMLPKDIEDIANALGDCTFGGRPYIYQEVIDRSDNEAITAREYFNSGDVTEFKYCDKIIELVDPNKQAKYFHDFGENWNMMPSSEAFVFVDNHDNQRNHGGGGNVATYKDPWKYKKVTAFGLAWDYGTSRIMSSYAFDNTDVGPPSDGNGNTQSPIINADSTCGGGWICEHRWRQIRNMACFRNAAGYEGVKNWYDNGADFIAFSRGDKAFFAFSDESYAESKSLQTGLPQGSYCDLISGDPTGSGCTGKQVDVDGSGYANIQISPGEDSMIALTRYATTSSKGGYCTWK